MFEELEGLSCNTGSNPEMSFREVVLMMAKNHPEILADTLDKIRNSHTKEENSNSAESSREKIGDIIINHKTGELIIKFDDNKPDSLPTGI